MNTERTHVRAAQITDIDQLVTLLGQLFDIEQAFVFDEAIHRKGLMDLFQCSGQAWIWVATLKDTVVGMCSAQRLISTAMGSPVLHIEDVVVDRNYRGRGIGSALLAHIETWALEHGYKRLQLVADGTNRPALDFYHGRNWEKTCMIWHRKQLFD